MAIISLNTSQVCNSLYHYVPFHSKLAIKVRVEQITWIRNSGISWAIIQSSTYKKNRSTYSSEQMIFEEELYTKECLSLSDFLLPLYALFLVSDTDVLKSRCIITFTFFLSSHSFSVDETSTFSDDFLSWCHWYCNIGSSGPQLRSDLIDDFNFCNQYSNIKSS